MKARPLASLLAIAALLAFLAPTHAVIAAPGQSQHDHQAQAGPTEGAAKGQMKMGQMKAGEMKMEAMAAQRKANTQRIESLMARVKTSTGEARVEAMAEVITILLEERTAMQEHCSAGCPMMKP